MALLSNYELITSGELTPVGVLEIDMDASANRIVIFDRDSLDNLYSAGFSSPLEWYYPLSIQQQRVYS